MRAPARGIVNGSILPLHETINGVKVYRQIDDELLEAVAADLKNGGCGEMATMIGMLIARVREAERDRDGFDTEGTRRAADMHDLKQQRDLTGLALREMHSARDGLRAEVGRLEERATLADNEAASAWANVERFRGDLTRAATAIEELTKQRNALQRDLDDLLQYVADAKAEAQKLGSYTGESLAQFLRALQEAMTPAAIASLTRQAREALEEADRLKANLDEVGCHQPLPGSGYANTRALRAEGELLVLQRAAKKIEAWAGPKARMENLVQFDEHEEKAWREAMKR